ncbi:MAG: zinc ribbon domain-containing protein [Promethearchaeota archaeon]
MKVNVIYEETLQVSIVRAFELSMQWLNSQHKAKIKKSTPPTFIEAKQGTMMTNTGHDPNWKKSVRINLYDLNDGKTLIRVEASPLGRNILRIEKLKQSWYNGLFSHLFTLLRTIEETTIHEVLSTDIDAKSQCYNCGNKIDKDAIICPSCGIEIP